MAKTFSAPKLASEIEPAKLEAMATSKLQAHIRGTKQYYDGVKCGNGHIAIRARSTGHCMECNDL